MISLKKIFSGVIALYVVAPLFAQNLTDKGFENVRVLNDSTRCIITVEDNSHRSKKDAVVEATGFIDNYYSQCDSATLIFLKSGVPVISMKRLNGVWNTYYTDKNDFRECASLKPLNSTAGKIDLFLGAELWYRDYEFSQMYEAVVNLNPAVRWRLGKGFEAAAQVTIPIYNDYGDYYKKVRLTMASLSYFTRLAPKNYLKASLGMFSKERYGADLKLWHAFNKYWMVDAQFGFTGFCSMAVNWEASYPKRFLAVGGINYNIPQYDLQVRVSGGRYMYDDYGATIDVLRHFKHCTIGGYAQYCEKGVNYYVNNKTLGFYVVMDLLPYKKKRKSKINCSLASNFRLTYNAATDQNRCKIYHTDPEESERDGIIFNPFYFQNALCK